MRDFIGNIRTFETENFRVTVDADCDYDVDLSFDESGEIKEKLESGDLISFVVSCKVLHKPTGAELGTDYLGGCIYKSIEEFQDHRECAAYSRKLLRRDGRFQIYRTNRKYKNVLERKDKLKKRGFATRERAENWAKAHAKEEWEVKQSGVCGSYFADMIHSAIKEARKSVVKMQGIKLRSVKNPAMEYMHGQEQQIKA